MTGSYMHSDRTVPAAMSDSSKRVFACSSSLIPVYGCNDSCPSPTLCVAHIWSISTSVPWELHSSVNSFAHCMHNRKAPKCWFCFKYHCSWMHLTATEKKKYFKVVYCSVLLLMVLRQTCQLMKPINHSGIFFVTLLYSCLFYSDLFISKLTTDMLVTVVHSAGRKLNPVCWTECSCASLSVFLLSAKNQNISLWMLWFPCWKQRL